jgi:hypothetical protein
MPPEWGHGSLKGYATGAGGEGAESAKLRDQHTHFGEQGQVCLDALDQDIFG